MHPDDPAAAAKAALIEAAGQRWDTAVADVMRFLTDGSPEVRELAYRLIKCRSQDWYMFCGGDPNTGTPYSYKDHSCTDTVGRLEFIRYFIGHQLLDDGDPTIAWAYYDGMEGDWPLLDEVYDLSEDDQEYVKDPDDEFGIVGAHPVFHTSMELRRRTHPDSKILHCDGALLVLDWYERRQAALDADIETSIREGGIFDEDDRNPRSSAEQDLLALADHLKTIADGLLQNSV